MDTDLVCALLSALVSQHQYGQPISRDDLLQIASYESHRGGDAKSAFDELRGTPFVVDRGSRGISIDNAEFGRIAQFMYQECSWSEFELRIRLKHFEGWERVDFD